MNPLVREAIEIAHDLGNVVVIGAVAVMVHTDKGRQSADVDIAMITQLSREEMISKEYFPIPDKRDSWYSPRKIKVDIFRKDVSGIPVETVINTAKPIEVDNHGTILKVASIEVLIVAKYRAFNQRKSGADESDLRMIAKRKFKEIDWDLLKNITTETEFADIKRTMTAIHNM